MSGTCELSTGGSRPTIPPDEVIKIQRPTLVSFLRGGRERARTTRSARNNAHMGDGCSQGAPILLLLSLLLDMLLMAPLSKCVSKC